MISKLEAINMVLRERIAQDVKWGFPQDNTPFEWVSFLTEETGEFATAVNDAFAGKNPSRDVAKAIKEATHVSAVALAFIEHYALEDV